MQAAVKRKPCEQDRRDAVGGQRSSVALPHANPGCPYKNPRETTKYQFQREWAVEDSNLQPWD
jgi:hypothetical protein